MSMLKLSNQDRSFKSCVMFWPEDEGAGYIMINNENSTNLSVDSLPAPQIQIIWGFLSGPCDRQCDHMLLLISKPYQLVARIESTQFLFKCCEKNCPNYMYWIPGKHRGSWASVFLRLFVSLKLVLLSLLSFNLFLYICLICWVSLAGNSLRTEKSHWQVQKVALARPENHTRAKMSHWSVITINNKVLFNDMATIPQCLMVLNAWYPSHWKSNHGQSPWPWSNAEFELTVLHQVRPSAASIMIIYTMSCSPWIPDVRAGVKTKW